MPTIVSFLNTLFETGSGENTVCKNTINLSSVIAGLADDHQMVKITNATIRHCVTEVSTEFLMFTGLALIEPGYTFPTNSVDLDVYDPIEELIDLSIDKDFELGKLKFCQAKFGNRIPSSDIQEFRGTIVHNITKQLRKVALFTESSLTDEPVLSDVVVIRNRLSGVNTAAVHTSLVIEYELIERPISRLLR